MKHRTTLILVSVLTALLGAASLQAQPTCTGTEHLMEWPTSNPVWKFCWLRPSDSSGPRGSGLEFREVYYNDILVFKRAHAPILNVEYESGGCGCYRDWCYEESPIRADNTISGGYFEPTSPARTVCDESTTGTWEGDCPWGGAGPCVEGVAAEKYTDRLVMTTQYQAGWYRYTTRWTFHLDGTVEPRFGFGTVNDTCGSTTHRHHTYWRLDFDIDGAGNDSVSEQGANAQTFTTEVDRTWGDGTVTWEVRDSGGLGYRITPGAQDLMLPADSYSKTDFIASLYHATELQDEDGGLFDCDVEVDDIVDNESIANTDVVVYYRNGVEDVPGLDVYLCKTAGPTLTPIGNWGTSGIFEDGFETGNTSAWSSAVP